MSPEIRVLLVDDHTMLRESLHQLLAAQPGIRVVGEAADGLEAIRQVDDRQPAVVVMDITMPHMDGLAATAEIRRRHPAVEVVILTMHSGHYVHAILESGAIAYVMKTAVTDELVAAVRAAARGERYFPEHLFGYLADQSRRRPRHGDEGDGLTDREQQVLALIAGGLHNVEIAERLGISVKTVETHRHHLMRKLAARDRTDLVRYALGQQLATDGVAQPLRQLTSVQS